MIYSIDGKYYVNISPSIYVEVNPTLNGDNIALMPTRNKIEVNSNTNIIPMSLEDIKNSLHDKKVEKKNDTINVETIKTTTNKNKFGRRNNR